VNSQVTAFGETNFTSATQEIFFRILNFTLIFRLAQLLNLALKKRILELMTRSIYKTLKG
jgi:hypothetical protein